MLFLRRSALVMRGDLAPNLASSATTNAAAAAVPRPRESQNCAFS